MMGAVRVGRWSVGKPAGNLQTASQSSNDVRQEASNLSAKLHFLHFSLHPLLCLFLFSSLAH